MRHGKQAAWDEQVAEAGARCTRGLRHLATPEMHSYGFVKQYIYIYTSLNVPALLGKILQ